MLAVKHERGIEAFSMEDTEFENENLLDTINFDDILIGIGDGDVLPDLEIDNEFFAEFSGSESETKLESENISREDAAADSVSDVDLVQKPEPEPEVKDPDLKEADDTSKISSSRCKNPPGKKKTKVDWTPELHRRFVQAVEQLGIDKAVPSRILEIMGNDCLTRHNIASHLQRFPRPPTGVPAVQTVPQPPSDVHPSKESIDAAIGDVLKKPWLPLPLGLKPPSMDSVMAELRRKGAARTLRLGLWSGSGYV
ncbi:hypothetical protein SASPL_114108 [Salvia splendens]|uniref:HTH myb-type domain-containing protein n=1 Tax=Salvia splendens TaxID=180675 RepID=A0A8X8Y026_SALSN|nr:hypothetical protein SASPL_114108 [Salvia splendens]